MKRVLIAFSVCGILGAAPASKKPDIVASISPQDMARSISYDERSIPTVHTRLHYTTVFVLPKSEKIMDLLCGEKSDWTVNGADGTNFAYIKPEKAGARTNLNLVTASGNVYSFLLVEGDGNPDLKVFVNTKDAALLSTMAARPKWVTASELDSARKETESARSETAAARAETAAAREDTQRAAREMEARADSEIATFKSGFPSSLKHDYTYRDKRKFGVRAIAHDDRFTYIWANPQETPALYEIKDGNPNLISFEFRNGLYVAPKVLDSGYLAVGKARLSFKREE